MNVRTTLAVKMPFVVILPVLMNAFVPIISEEILILSVQSKVIII